MTLVHIMLYLDWSISLQHFAIDVGEDNILQFAHGRRPLSWRKYSFLLFVSYKQTKPKVAFLHSYILHEQDVINSGTCFSSILICENINIINSYRCQLV